MKDNREELLLKIKKEVIDLKGSTLADERIKNNALTVIGEGDHHAKLMLVGEAPGKNEAEKGRPFCGASGKVLDQLFASIGMERKDAYVTNIVKDRPPLNRDPLPEEIRIYAQFLDRQIEAIKPKVIATLGRYSMIYIMQRFGLESELKPIGEMHGKIFDAKTSYGTIKIVPLYHPAVALYNGNRRPELIKDFQIIKKLL